MNHRNRVVQISNIPKNNNAKQASTNKFSNATVNRDPSDKGKSMEQDAKKDKAKEKMFEEVVHKEVSNKELLEKNDVP